MLGVLVGLRAEAQLIRPYVPGLPVALSGATSDGARRAVARLLESGVSSILSFGCAAGLAPDLEPGAIVIPQRVVAEGRSFRTDAELSRRFGVNRPEVLHGEMLHSDTLVATGAEKARLYARTGCLAVDMESGFVARTGLPFAVLRVICDDSRRDLPPAALDVLNDGRISPFRLASSLIRRPGQIPSLMALGRDASKARAAMRQFLCDLGA